MVKLVINPTSEADRLAAVRRYDILDTPPDGAFDHITELAARRFEVPISIVSIVDTDRIWFKSHYGLSVREISRDPGLCASAILSTEPHVLCDAKADPRALANPLVAGDFGLRFYAGAPLQTSDGYNLGTLCVIDTEPRPIDADQIADLKALASIVMDQLELRLAARRAVERAEIMAREIDHRMMNSLQFISGMLNMQSRQPRTSDAGEELRTAANRVAAIARVHRNFFMSEPAERVACRPFLERLCEDLSNILGRHIVAQVDDGTVLTDKLVSIGLIANELATNAAKHGSGEIELFYRINGSQHELGVCDEGEGLPHDFDFGKPSPGLGMKVIAALAAQLKGDVRVASSPRSRNSCIIVRFPS